MIYSWFLSPESDPLGSSEFYRVYWLLYTLGISPPLWHLAVPVANYT